MFKSFCALGLSCCAFFASADVWNWQHINVTSEHEQTVYAARSEVSPTELWFQGNIKNIEEQLRAAAESNQPFQIKLPQLDSSELIDYVIHYSPIFAQSLATKYPAIKTFRGYQLNAPTNTGHFEIGDNGFFGVYEVDGVELHFDGQLGQAGFQRLFKKSHMTVLDEALVRHGDGGIHDGGQVVLARGPLGNDVELIEFTIAIATTAEYTQFFGGVNQALSAIATTLNRVNRVFESELAIRFVLVDNNDAIIQTSTSLDPFENDISLDDLAANQTLIDTEIGANNYDLGHLLATGVGGLSTVAVVCDLTGFKAQAATGLNQPLGEMFNIDFFAHELGHQFGAGHTFNGGESACSGQRSGASAYEPGSGSTIMSYAGICGSQSIELRVDDYFHSASIIEINQFLTSQGGQTCGTPISLGNDAPFANAGANYSIPAQTPFVLTGSASDNDGDTLNYSWEQYDLGTETSSASEMVDRGEGPLFRAWPLTDTPVRYFPRLEDVIDGGLSLGESYPSTTRNLNFNFVVRDSEGGVGIDTNRIQVVGSAGPFEIFQPSGFTRVEGGETLQVEWDVARTHLSPISCSNVDILLSDDNGLSFSTELLTNVDNDGLELVPMPNQEISSARLMIKCSNNVFFAITPTRFEISVSAIGTPPTLNLFTSLSVLEDNDFRFSIDDFDIVDPDSSSFTFNIDEGENYTVDEQTVTPNRNFNGQLTIPVSVSDNVNNISNTLNVVLTVMSVNDAPSTTQDNVTLSTSDAVLVDVLANDSDVDSLTLSLQDFSYSGDGEVSIVNNEISYTADTEFTGSENLIYTVADEQGAEASGILVISIEEPADRVIMETSSTSDVSSSSSSSSGGSLSWFCAWVLILAYRKVYVGVVRNA